MGPPGPVAIAALLSKSGLKSKGKVTVANAVNAVSETWLAAAVADVASSPVTSPIHHALDRRAETGAGEGWIKGWSAVTELADDQAAAPAVLAELFYREHLFLKFS
jgi:hypothetical protein